MTVFISLVFMHSLTSPSFPKMSHFDQYPHLLIYRRDTQPTEEKYTYFGAWPSHNIQQMMATAYHLSMGKGKYVISNAHRSFSPRIPANLNHLFIYANLVFFNSVHWAPFEDGGFYPIWSHSRLAHNKHVDPLLIIKLLSNG